MEGGEPPPWLFMVAGDLRLEVAESGTQRNLDLSEGAFVLWQNGAVVGMPARAVSDGGCTVLCVGHDLSGGG